MIQRKLHPSKEIIGIGGTELHGKKVVLCVTGSVASYRAIDLARLLMRHGADVHAVMSKAGEMMVSSEMLTWATGNKAITALTGNLEHIALADYGRSDLVIVYPCTANTLGKAANGIDDTPVTSLLSVGLGSNIPIIVAPAMHEAMYQNSRVAHNIKQLESIGVIFANPSITEGKAKVAEPDQVLQIAIERLSPKTLTGRRILVTAGSTIEYIDPVRIVTNLSSGKMGAAIASAAIAAGAKVTVIFGIGTEIPRCDKLVRVKTSREMHEAVLKELGFDKYDAVIMAAAVADFSPNKKELKIESRNGPVSITMSPTRKIVNDVKKKMPDTMLVAFKAEWGLSESALLDKARSKLKECNADYIVANDLSTRGAEPGSSTTEVHVIGKDGSSILIPLASKAEVARKLVGITLKSLSSTVPLKRHSTNSHSNRPKINKN